MLENDAVLADSVRQAEAAATLEETLRIASDALLPRLLETMKQSGIPKAEQAVDALKRSGLDKLLIRAMGMGRLSHSAVRSELDRLMKALAQRTLTAVDIKAGILAFDESARRLAMSSGKGGPFRYPSTQNRARDSLITFARSLHR
jgi:hypothetical protein